MEAISLIFVFILLNDATGRHCSDQALPNGIMMKNYISDREMSPLSFEVNPGQKQSCASQRGLQKAFLIKNQL